MCHQLDRHLLRQETLGVTGLSLVIPHISLSLLPKPLVLATTLDPTSCGIAVLV